jgi:DNA adenine methylase
LVNTGDAGQGVNRKLPHLGDAGQGVNRKIEPIMEWFAALADRLAGVRVACGDWTRVCGSSVTDKHGVTGVFLDPPYPTHDRAETYTHDCGEVSYRVRDWAIANGGNPKLRIALCGYDGHWEMPDDWETFVWKTAGGYGSQGKGTRGAANAHRERIWFSPHCLKSEVTDLFGVE